ncbi:MAG: hypothetical protein RBS08_00735 [Bdellovibrionales bacterium]|jgi:hypothetical protein|nr:hypothetical protein [Bdellovibrionales bacterium]
MSDIKGFLYVGKGHDDSANNGLGADVARFVIVHKGREQEAESLANAFRGDKDHLRARTGVVQWRADQVDEQIEKIKSRPDLADTLGQLSRAKADLEGVSTASRNEFGKKAAKAKAPPPAVRYKPSAGLRIS